MSKRHRADRSCGSHRQWFPNAHSAQSTEDLSVEDTHRVLRTETRVRLLVDELEKSPGVPPRVVVVANEMADMIRSAVRTRALDRRAAGAIVGLAAAVFMVPGLTPAAHSSMVLLLADLSTDLLEMSAPE